MGVGADVPPDGFRIGYAVGAQEGINVAQVVVEAAEGVGDAGTGQGVQEDGAVAGQTGVEALPER